MTSEREVGTNLDTAPLFGGQVVHPHFPIARSAGSLNEEEECVEEWRGGDERKRG